MKTQNTIKNQLTGNIAMYRNALSSGHKIDKRTWQGKNLIVIVKEMNDDPCPYTNHPATKYLSVGDHKIIGEISLN